MSSPKHERVATDDHDHDQSIEMQNPLRRDADDASASSDACDPHQPLSSGTERRRRSSADDAWQSTPRTFAAAACAVLNQVTFGYDVGAVSQCLQPIERTFRLTQLQTGFVTSALNFFAAAGALVVSGALLDRIGRKGALLVAAALLVAGGALVAAAWSFETLVAGRFLQGLGVGCSWSASGIYVTEIAPSAHRGALVALVDVAINLGIIGGYCAAYAIAVNKVGRESHVAPWRVSMGLSALPPLLFVLACPFLPESPRWLATRRKVAAARRAMKALAKPTATREALDAAHEALVDANSPGRPLSRVEPEEDDDPTWAAAACSRRGRYAAALGVVQQATGTEAILYFAPTVLPGGSPREKFLGNVGVGLAKFVGEVIASYLADAETAFLGRRTMTIWGSGGVALGLFAFAALSGDDGAFAPGARLPLLVGALSFTMLSFSLGPGPFSTVFVNEVVPTKHRAKSSAWSCFLNRLTSASVALSFLSLSTTFGAPMVFLAYACVASASTVFYARTLPDTVGVSLEELQG